MNTVSQHCLLTRILRSVNSEERQHIRANAINWQKSTQKKGRTMDKITVYTDGSALSNGRPGSGCGWACKLMYKGQARMKSGGAIGETNNRMEMQAVLEAMKSITDKTIPVEVYSDSNYVVETMNGHFVMKKNRDLWRKLMRERQKFTNIRFIWVKGHDKNQHNNDVDRQAVAESRKILEAQENGQV